MTPPKKSPTLKLKQPTLLTRSVPKAQMGRHGRQFSAPRAPKSFTDDPPGFATEVDQRGKPDDTWFNLPHPTGFPPFRVDLASILDDEAIKKIVTNKRLVFHAVGDTGGVNTTTYQQQVATYMELDFSEPDLEAANPSFFYHLGDVVYYDGEIPNYYWEFYEPYEHYPAPIVAIPGNHDGDVDPNDQFNQPSDSLKGFVRNFCAQAPVRLPEAKDAPRDAMTQPNVYWTLNTPMATIIGLYTNVPSGGVIHPDQLAWFKQELVAAPNDRALILALHHPVFSAYGPHPGSLKLKTVVEEAFKETNRTPNLILTAHVHDYQHLTGYFNGRAVPTLVVGAGGYNQKLHQLDRKLFKPEGVPYKYDTGPETLDKFNDFQHGYLIVDVREDKIVVSYIAVDDPKAGDPVATKPAAPYESFEIPL